MQTVVGNFTAIFTQLASGDLEGTVSNISTTAVFAGSAALLFLVIMAVTLNKRMPGLKPALFGLIVIVVLGVTLTISGGTIYLNVKSATGGPVHWHADVEFWACGNELELRDPTGFLSNKIGTPTLHEHNDKRIHLEGVPVDLPHDASLGKFMNVVGGGVSDNSLVVPLNDERHFEDTLKEVDGDGSAAPQPEEVQPYIMTDKDGKYAKFVSGETCGQQPAEVQVFAYTFNSEGKTYQQTKLEHPQDYQIAGHSDVPPGACIIFEFAPKKDRTDKLCQQYGVRDINRCADFGVRPDERKVCENMEIR